MAWAMIYAFVMPLAVGVAANWHPLSSRFGSALFRWQTLTAGILAIVAALITGAFVFHQTNEARRQEAANQARQLAAARAVLPLALSTLIEHANEVAISLEGLRASVVRHRVEATSYVAPALDPAVIPPLRDVVAAADGPVAEQVASVLSDVQVLTARLRGLSDSLYPESSSIVVESNLDEYIVNAATLYARCSYLFEYARRATETAPPPFPSEKDLLNALNLMRFDEFTHAPLYSRAKIRAAASEKT